MVGRPEATRRRHGVIPADPLAQLAEPDQILVSQTTAALLEGDRDAPELRDLGDHKLPDFDSPMRIYELTKAE
jgi:class 3 adenylate cyclase